ncbi:zinc finger protein 37-like [Osmerus eperlanus]|uniref:zinc finger protein 37-like n=1 Tax=Osmerus eperlanus TaxID=29151 RepID=UPI002E132F8C
MAQMQLLRMIVKERLAAAADEIFGVVEKTIAEYQHEVACSRRDYDNLRRMLESSRDSINYFHRSDPQPRTVPAISEKVHPEQHRDDKSPVPQDLNKELQDLVVIKQEEEEVSLWSCQREAQLQRQQDVNAESGHDEDQAHSSHVNVGGEEHRYKLSQPSSCTAEQMKPNFGEAPQENESTRETLFVISPAFSAVQSQKVESVDEKKPYICTVCGKCFSHTANMRNHMRVHTGEKPYSCKECGKRFIEAGNRNTHMRIHTGEKPFPCIVCGKWFRHRSGVNMHMKIHTGDKVYACKVCGKTFTESGNLTTHMRIHTQENPYPCTICGRTFRHKSSMKIHMNTHMKDVVSGHLDTKVDTR